MPLNNTFRADTEKFLRELPFDRECLNTQDVTYQTKVDIFDRKCSGCGYARIEVLAKGRDVVRFNRSDEAVSFALQNRYGHPIIDRGCAYPPDIAIVNGKERCLTLSEIVTNGCQFWKEETLHIFDDAETEFIEIEMVRVIELVELREMSGERISE
jgi:hypothetical protein